MNVEDNFTIGYLDFPNQSHKPLPGTEAEIIYCRGWLSAQNDTRNNDEILEQECLFGRDTFAVDYWSGK